MMGLEFNLVLNAVGLFLTSWQYDITEVCVVRGVWQVLGFQSNCHVWAAFSAEIVGAG